MHTEGKVSGGDGWTSARHRRDDRRETGTNRWHRRVAEGTEREAGEAREKKAGALSLPSSLPVILPGMQDQVKGKVAGRSCLQHVRLGMLSQAYKAHL